MFFFSVSDVAACGARVFFFGFARRRIAMRWCRIPDILFVQLDYHVDNVECLRDVAELIRCYEIHLDMAWKNKEYANSRHFETLGKVFSKKTRARQKYTIEP